MLSSCATRGCGKDSAAFPGRLLHRLFPNDHICLCQSLSVPGTQGPGQIIPARLQHDGRLCRRDYLGNQHQQLSLQSLHITRGIDDIRNFEKRAQIARHAAYSRGIGRQARDIEVNGQ